MARLTYLTVLAAGVALLLWSDRSPSGAANQATLAILLLGAGPLGYAAPRPWRTRPDRSASSAWSACCCSSSPS